MLPVVTTLLPSDVIKSIDKWSKKLIDKKENEYYIQYKDKKYAYLLKEYKKNIDDFDIYYTNQQKLLQNEFSRYIHNYIFDKNLEERADILKKFLVASYKKYEEIEPHIYFTLKDNLPNTQPDYNLIINKNISNEEKLIELRTYYKILLDNESISAKQYYNVVDISINNFVIFYNKYLKDYLNLLNESSRNLLSNMRKLNYMTQNIENILKNDNIFVNQMSLNDKNLVKTVTEFKKIYLAEQTNRNATYKQDMNKVINYFSTEGFNFKSSIIPLMIENDINNVLNSFPAYEAKIKKQIVEENNLAININYCPSNNYKDSVHDRLQTLNISNILNLYDNFFYNYEFMKAISCLLNSLNTKDRKLRNNQRLKRYLTHLKIITTNTAGGNPVFATLGLDNPNTNNFFVIKTVKDINEPNDFVHESLVCLLCLNDLRKKIPNFSFIYSTFKCGGVVSKGKDVELWCGYKGSNSTLSEYIVYENITHSISMLDYIRKCSIDEFMDVFMQIIYSLKLASEECDFTHYDLHLLNVLVRSISNISIKYDDNLYINTNKIATIIDYGRAHVKYKNKDYGEVTGPYRSTYNKGFILTDVHGILCRCLNSIPRPAIEKAKYLLLYFYKSEIPENVLNHQSKTKYYLPISMNIKFDINNFIKYCIFYCEVFNIKNPLESTPKYTLLQCDNNCSNFDQTMSSIGININGPVPEPDTFLLFYDTFSFINDSIKQKYIEEFYKVHFNKALSSESNYAKKIEQNFNSIIPTSLDSLDKNVLDSVDISSDFDTSIKYLDLYDLLKESKAIIDYTMKKFTEYKFDKSDEYKKLSELSALYSNLMMNNDSKLKKVETFLNKGVDMFINKRPTQKVLNLKYIISDIAYNQLINVLNILVNDYL